MATRGMRGQQDFGEGTIDEPKPSCLSCFGLFAKRSSSRARVQDGNRSRPRNTQQISTRRLRGGEQTNGFAKQVNDKRTEPAQAAPHENNSSSSYTPAGHSMQGKQKFINEIPEDKNLQQSHSLIGPSEDIRQRDNKKNGKSAEQQPGQLLSNKEKKDVNNKSSVPQIVPRQESFNKHDEYKETNTPSKSSAENDTVFRQPSCPNKEDHKYTNNADPPRTTAGGAAQNVVRQSSFKKDDKHTDTAPLSMEEKFVKQMSFNKDDKHSIKGRINGG